MRNLILVECLVRKITRNNALYPICLTFDFSNARHDNQQITSEICIVTFSDLLFHRDDTEITIRRSLNNHQTSLQQFSSKWRFQWIITNRLI
ncbi:unnamed protein product [Adineta ricciae]|uniref:Uncharacterized protein n=1 Tax=Adineta ricciae TaxID=249248 RepID=A0A814YYE4_ADIRI|nr:unnamed protein product [Adineta ricciae]